MTAAHRSTQMSLFLHHFTPSSLISSGGEYIRFVTMNKSKPYCSDLWDLNQKDESRLWLKMYLHYLRKGQITLFTSGFTRDTNSRLLNQSPVLVKPSHSSLSSSLCALFCLLLLFLTTSFAAVIITAATRGRRLTRNVNTGCNKLL